MRSKNACGDTNEGMRTTEGGRPYKE